MKSDTFSCLICSFVPNLSLRSINFKRLVYNCWMSSLSVILFEVKYLITWLTMFGLIIRLSLLQQGLYTCTFSFLFEKSKKAGYWSETVVSSLAFYLSCLLEAIYLVLWRYTDVPTLSGISVLFLFVWLMFTCK